MTGRVTGRVSPKGRGAEAGGKHGDWLEPALPQAPRHGKQESAPLSTRIQLGDTGWPGTTRMRNRQKRRTGEGQAPRRLCPLSWTTHPKRYSAVRVFAPRAAGPPRRRSSRRPERPGSARGRGGAGRGLTSGRRGRGWPPRARKVSGHPAGAVTPRAPVPAFARASLPRAQPRSRRLVTLTLGPACRGASGRLRGVAGALAPRDRRVRSQGASARARKPQGREPSCPLCRWETEAQRSPWTEVRGQRA